VFQKADLTEYAEYTVLFSIEAGNETRSLTLAKGLHLRTDG